MIDMFFDYSSIVLSDDFVIKSISPDMIHSGAAEFTYRNMMNPVDVGWVGATMSPCGSLNDSYIEHPSDAFKYFLDRGVTEVSIEQKMMGSRACIVYQHKVVRVYSRGLRNVQLSSDELTTLTLECEAFASINGISEFIVDTEMLPWSRLSSKSIERDFIVPAMAYKMSIGETPEYMEYRNLLNKFSKSSELKFYIFDLVAFNQGGESGWQKNFGNNNFRVPLDCKCMQQLPFSVVLDISKILNQRSILDKWLELTTVQLEEGIVIKPLDKSLNVDDPVGIPYLKVRGKAYLRMVYGIDYDINEVSFSKLKRRHLKRKRIDSMYQYVLTRLILNEWINYQRSNINPDELIRLLCGFLGSRNDNAKLGIVDATL